ncbi:hypothetical protein O9992_23240 [Vibrio lentus]|nr:hypothetical protein [Vibrio lentus]
MIEPDFDIFTSKTKHFPRAWKTVKESKLAMSDSEQKQQGLVVELKGRSSRESGSRSFNRKPQSRQAKSRAEATKKRDHSNTRTNGQNTTENPLLNARHDTGTVLRPNRDLGTSKNRKSNSSTTS